MNVHQIAITEDNVSDEAGLNARLCRVKDDAAIRRLR
ncbi:hypothetical protein QFZ94_008500 [Paraburkholderia sp. JPY465]